jgi:hypothetical protein
MEFVSLPGSTSSSSCSLLVSHPLTPSFLLPALLSGAAGRPRSLAKKCGREGGSSRAGGAAPEGQKRYGREEAVEGRAPDA